MSFCRHNNPASSGGAPSSRPPVQRPTARGLRGVAAPPASGSPGRALRVTSLGGDETSTAQGGISRPVPPHKKPRQTGALPPFRRCPATARPCAAVRAVLVAPPSVVAPSPWVGGGRGFNGDAAGLTDNAYPSLPLREAVALNQRARAGGDAEALAWFNGLFNQESECFTCAGPVGPHVTVQMIADPRHKNQALLVPICGNCAALPAQLLRHRILKMAKAMWPKAGVWKADVIPRRKRA
jgi:hypothetical protein